MFEDKVTVTLSGARGMLWTSILGTATLPVTSPTPEICRLEGQPDLPCYLLDWSSLSREQFKRMIAGVAKIFHTSAAAVTQDVCTKGMPIRAGEDVTVTVPDGWRPPRHTEAGAAIDMRFF